MKKTRIGIFGGSFNPPHLGHVNAIQMVRNRAGLDKVLIIPNSKNPLKKQVEGPSAAERLEMTKLAFRDLDQNVFIVDDIEIKREKTSYTIDTVEALKKREPNAEFHLIIGQDLLEELSEWKSWEKLLENVSLIVTSRPGYDFPKTKNELPEYLRPLAVDQDFNFVQLKSGREIQFLQLQDMDISSSNLRKWLRTGKKVEKYLPLAVENHINHNKLYQNLGDKIGDYKKFTDFCAQTLFARKAIQVRGFDLRGMVAPSEFAIICSGTSTRHTGSLAENVVQAVKEEFNLLPLSIEGVDEGRWVLVDYGSLIVHVFYDHIRQEYSLEKLWTQGIDLNLKDKNPAAADETPKTTTSISKSSSTTPRA